MNNIISRKGETQIGNTIKRKTSEERQNPNDIKKRRKRWQWKKEEKMTTQNKKIRNK